MLRVYRVTYSGNSGTFTARWQHKVAYGLGVGGRSVDVRWFESAARVNIDYGLGIDGNHKRAIMAAVVKNGYREEQVRDIHYGGDDGRGILWIVDLDV